MSTSTLWLTYAWDDNRDQDVDFVAQEIARSGVLVKLDRWNIGAGRRLWDQIATFITDPAQSDAWAIYATQNSLSSEACREELAYALDRALSLRGEVFPVMGLFPATVDRELIPASIRTRLYISLADPDWKQRLIAAVERRTPAIVLPDVRPYAFTMHPAPPPYFVVFEVRPRAGTWYPFMAGVPIAEKDRLGLALRSGPRGQVPSLLGVHITGGTGVSDDGAWHIEGGRDEATPTRSYYIFFKQMPTRFTFGQLNTKDQAFFWLAPAEMKTQIVRLYVSEKAHLDKLDAIVTQFGTDEARSAVEGAMRTIASRHGATLGMVNFLPDRAGFFYTGPDEVMPVAQASPGDPVRRVTAVDDPV